LLEGLQIPRQDTTGRGVAETGDRVSQLLPATGRHYLRTIGGEGSAAADREIITAMLLLLFGYAHRRRKPEENRVLLGLGKVHEGAKLLV